ncbi:hypothetical protein [Roseovarius nubinhibens]|uniref:Uncharacterized protein n=1 Tax=Roseovarius nubinhibens TaxID=314263 RepID=A0A348WGQ4_9RHOB|nr:hypothetical protein [Roseovarius nubinhibens]
MFSIIVQFPQRETLDHITIKIQLSFISLIDFEISAAPEIEVIIKSGMAKIDEAVAAPSKEKDVIATATI